MRRHPMLGMRHHCSTVRNHLWMVTFGGICAALSAASSALLPSARIAAARAADREFEVAAGSCCTTTLTLWLL